jgi:hypothetical protein
MPAQTMMTALSGQILYPVGNDLEAAGSKSDDITRCLFKKNVTYIV